MSALDDVRRLVDRAVTAYAGTPSEVTLLALRTRLDEPLRVALAGKVKAGKSTLLNALVGEELAPTDAGECTQIVTWYRDSHSAQVVVELVDGSSRQVPFGRAGGGALDPDLGSVDVPSIERLVVDWPSDRLRRTTLIDTPGTASLSEDVSARSTSFLTPTDSASSGADAVVYLMKHLHADDVRFLETFAGGSGGATPVNAIAVLSRADEVGAGRLDAMTSAARIAARYADDERVQRVCQTVVPVAGLVAQAGATLRESELAVLRSLAALDETEVERLLASADRFGAGSEERGALLLRLGVFGVRLATSLLRSGSVTTGPQLAAALTAASGLDSLRAALSDLFGARADALKARSGLVALSSVLDDAPAVEESASLRAELERVTASAHELAELSVVTALRDGDATGLPAADRSRALRLVGIGGARARLGLAADAGDDEVRQAAVAELTHWRARAENPVLGQDAVAACFVLVRTCEGMLARLD
jgi:hypothetical protein